MSWDAKAERITARAAAAQAEAEAERIRAQAGIEHAKAAAEIERTRQQDRRAVAAERQAKRQRLRVAVVKALRSNAVPVAAIGAPAVIAWRGQYEFAREVMHLGILSPLLPVAIEGSYLYTAMLAHQALEAGVPAGRYRAVTWALAGVAAGQQLWHGLTATGGAIVASDVQVGVSLGLTSLLGIGLLELTVALKQRATSGRTAAEIRRALVRRVRYPRLSAMAAGIAAARGASADDAWCAAWIDRYGIGPDSTRSERRTARAILKRERQTSRKAARAGALRIENGAILGRPEPVSGLEAWIAAQAHIGTAQIEAWLSDREPPTGGLTSPPVPPETDGPEGAAKTPTSQPVETTMRAAQIDSDRPESASTPEGSRQVTSAAAARRTAGDETRQRVANHMTAHPGDTVAQIANALDLSESTVKRHRRDIRTSRGDR